jgi:hypothetical protein
MIGFWLKQELTATQKRRTVMHMRKALHTFALVGIVILITNCKPSQSAQKTAPQAISFATLLQMFADQPDHIADRTIVVNNSPMKMRFAKKQARTRQEFYPLDQAERLKNEADRNYKIITLIQPGQPSVALDPQERTYAQMPDAFNLVPFDIESFLKNAASEMNKVKIEKIGTENIDGHAASKIRMRFEADNEEMYFYFASDLKNLFIKMDSGTIKQLQGSYTVSNVSFDVPDDLFEVPKEYKKVDFNSLISMLKSRILK